MIQISYLTKQIKQRFSDLNICILLSFVFLILSNTSKAQKDGEYQEYQSLFGNNISHGGYGGLSIGYTKIGADNALYSGFKGAWIVGHGIGIGIAGNGIVTELAADLIPNQEYSFISAGYGGLLLEPILFGLKPVHISMPIIIGTGAVVFDYGNYNEMSYNDALWRQFFVVEPALEIEMNVTRFFRMAVGASYRFTSDTDLDVTVLNETYSVVGENDLNTYNVYLSFKFGKF